MRFKPSLRETMLANHRAMEFLALGAPPEKQAAARELLDKTAAAIPAAPARRKAIERMDGIDIDAIHGGKRATPSAERRDLEGPVVRAISELLAVHPKVLFAVRQNTGMASYESASGRYAPVYFYRKLTHGKEITITDFWGILKDGRMLAVEAKAPGWSKPRDDHEFAQANFLALVRNAGGISLFATNADQVAAALK